MVTRQFSKLTLSQQFKYARQAGVPLLFVETPDPAATIRQVVRDGKYDKDPIVVWDGARGPVGLNDGGNAAVDRFGQPQVVMADPVIFAIAAENAPSKTIIAAYNIHEYFDKPACRQAIWNLRDQYKRDGRTFVMLGASANLPEDLRNDVVVLEEELPDQAALTDLTQKLDKIASTKPDGTPNKRKTATDETIGKVVDAIKGLAIFPAEQVVSMAIRADGIDLDHCWTAKKKQVEQTRGLSIYRGGENFEDLGGLEPIKKYLTRILTGRKPPKVIVWIDEIEKTGLANRQDSSGTNQDQEGTLLSFMEDYDVFGVMLLGVPGAGKSAICKAVGSQFDRVVIRLDLGEMLDKYVGGSQGYIRQALKVVKAVGGNETLWLATSNSVRQLSQAMKSRFCDTFFFDLPTKEERLPVWDVWLKKFGLNDEPFSDDDGWVPRNIKQCCDKAYRMNVSIEEAAETITPVGLTDREAIQELRKDADCRFLSANNPGVFRMPKSRLEPERSFSLDD